MSNTGTPPTDSPSDAPNGASDKDTSAAPKDPATGLQDALLEAAMQGGVSPAVTDAITQALVLVLGSGPALAAYQGMLAAQSANGILYHNAVSNQQKTNLLGMAMTAKCVRYMLDPHDNALDDILEEELKP
ncbi:MAG TPA: RebB family R body protein [Rhizomicrobium sp.]|jgi:hypothetical protein